MELIFSFLICDPESWRFSVKKTAVFRIILWKNYHLLLLSKNFSKIFAFAIDFLFFYDRIKTRFIKRKKMFGKFPS